MKKKWGKEKERVHGKGRRQNKKGEEYGTIRSNDRIKTGRSNLSTS